MAASPEHAIISQAREVRKWPSGLLDARRRMDVGEFVADTAMAFAVGAAHIHVHFEVHGHALGLRNPDGAVRLLLRRDVVSAVDSGSLAIHRLIAEDGAGHAGF